MARRCSLRYRANAAYQTQLISLPVISWRLAGRASKENREVTVAGAADPMRDLRNRQVRLPEQRFRSLDPARQNKAMG